jgi:hypothetical protein
MNRYPLKVVNGGEDSYFLFSLGHHTKEDFAHAIANYIGYGWRMGLPEQIYMVRTVRAGYSSYYVECDATHPRAIPCTSAIEDYSDESKAFYAEVLK